MNKQEALAVRKITEEYVKFVHKTVDLFEDVKRATVLSLKKVLKLKDGDLILINSDGSIEIQPKSEDEMSENKEKASEKITLNGREVSEEELAHQRESAENQKGAKLEEVSKGNFRLHLKD